MARANSQQNAQSQERTQKIGQGHLEAWLRAGLKELGQILPATKDSVRPVEELGLFGNPVSQEVFRQRTEEPKLDQELEMGL